MELAVSVKILNLVVSAFDIDASGKLFAFSISLEVHMFVMKFIM